MSNRVICPFPFSFWHIDVVLLFRRDFVVIVALRRRSTWKEKVFFDSFFVMRAHLVCVLQLPQVSCFLDDISNMNLPNQKPTLHA